MSKHNRKIWAIIPARGGSKSIPLKNMAALSGRPLIDYVIKAGILSTSIDRIICSTENRQIADFCLTRGVEVHKRPIRLAKDDTPVEDVLIELIGDYQNKINETPFAIVLLQPTSPFVLPQHIDECVRILREEARVNSSQTISKCPHHYHAYNQRIKKDDSVRFRFMKERKICYNKQRKPEFYVFGNIVATKTKALLRRGEIFARPCAPYEIPLPYAFDVDGPWDLKVAENLLENKMLRLPKDIG